MLQKHRDHDLRVAPRRYTNKPDIVVERAAQLALALAKRVAHHLSRPGFAGNIHPLYVRAAGRSARLKYTCHGIGDGDPALRIKWYPDRIRRIIDRSLFIRLRQLV